MSVRNSKWYAGKKQLYSQTLGSRVLVRSASLYSTVFLNIATPVASSAWKVPECVPMVYTPSQSQ